MSVDDELAELGEFALLRENARAAGVTAALPAVERLSMMTPAGLVSVLKWGSEDPRMVLLHGGGQNAHTWDTAILAAEVPAIAIDLPGHGRSDWRADRDYRPWTNADTLEPVLRRFAPNADLLVGMSLGGLTAIRLASTVPDLVRKLVVVDVTPGVTTRVHAMTERQRGTTTLVGGQRVFSSFAEMLDQAVAAAPARDRESLRRGVLHNSRRRADGRWEWRYDILAGESDYSPLWEDLERIVAPTFLVRGAQSAFVSDTDVAEFRKRAPGAQVQTVTGAGHSVQSDAPLELARLLRGVLGA
ncbi:alpha/beta fold hydrolase [Nocardia coffeae]|uniref:alpha/beta fold hydrolase n=1 Tax=Nocardia coffeae TaxID=2873381 RepID=UPI0027DFE015|nr:alpha/beta hydrolase [Nocardia coffeae]